VCHRGVIAHVTLALEAIPDAHALANTEPAGISPLAAWPGTRRGMVVAKAGAGAEAEAMAKANPVGANVQGVVDPPVHPSTYPGPAKLS